MKNVLSILIIGFIFFACTKSPEQKAQIAIKEYLKKNLNDAKSYEPVEFGNLIYDSTVFIETKKGKELDDFMKYCKEYTDTNKMSCPAKFDKKYNKWVSSIRVRVEHIIASVKIYRKVKDKFRGRLYAREDNIMLIACALYNLKIRQKNI